MGPLNLPSQSSADQITTISKRTETADPVLENLRSLKITSPILTTPPTEGSLTDILVRKSSTASAQDEMDDERKNWYIENRLLYNHLGEMHMRKVKLDKENKRKVNQCWREEMLNNFSEIMVLLELFSMYRDWEEEKAQEISKKQEDIENRIEVADALAVKLLQRFNYSVSTMKTASQHLSEVHTLQVELGELKGRLTEVLSNCDALCKRIAAEGTEPLRSSVKPFAVVTANSTANSSSSDKPTNQSSTSLEDELE